MLGFFLLAVVSAWATADERSEKAAQLERLQVSIRETQNRIRHQTSRQNRLQIQLRDLETRMGEIASAIKLQERNIRMQSESLQNLTQHLSSLKNRLRLHQVSLAHLVVATYKIGHRETLRLLLNQEDPAKFSRILTYSDYLNRVRAHQISRTKSLVLEVSTSQNQLAKKKRELESIQSALIEERKSLRRQRRERRDLLTKLDQSIANEQQRLETMETNRTQLEELVRSLDELLADIPAAPLVQKPFATVKGQLPWPTNGRLEVRYNQHRGTGNLRWKGILLAAPAGREVRAIYYGQVVFADWLQGFGLIAIVDHGEGFMSLYGHNESLLKEAGDWVQPGDAIANVGNSGGHSKSGLYFEVRKAGKPQNPLHWIGKTYHTTAQLP